MELKSLNCPFCGAGGLENHDANLWRCVHCGADFAAHSAQGEYEKLEATIKSGLGSVVDEALLREKTDKYYNLRSLLWGKITANYIDSKAIVSICRDILSIAQHDFLAEFFEIANSANSAEIAEYIQNIDEEENALLVEVVLDFIIKSLKEEYITPTAALLERCGNRIFSPEKKQAYLTKFEAEAAKVQNGIYELGIERDVFLAYSSKDMPKVLELLHLIESNGLTCFAAFRNLQHGRDAVANYDKALGTAIDHCSIFLFVSSENSRSFSCDAFKKEIAYIRNCEMNRHPEYRSYTQIPEKFKKLRIEYRLDNTSTPMVDKNLKEFFSGLTYVEDQEQLFARLGECMEKLNAPYVDEAEEKRRIEEDIRRKLEEELHRKAEEESYRKAEDARRRAVEEDARRKAEETRRKAEETRRKTANEIPNNGNSGNEEYAQEIRRKYKNIPSEQRLREIVEKRDMFSKWKKAAIVFLFLYFPVGIILFLTRYWRINKDIEAESAKYDYIRKEYAKLRESENGNTFDLIVKREQQFFLWNPDVTMTIDGVKYNIKKDSSMTLSLKQGAYSIVFSSMLRRKSLDITHMQSTVILLSWNRITGAIEAKVV